MKEVYGYVVEKRKDGKWELYYPRFYTKLFHAQEARDAFKANKPEEDFRVIPLFNE
jgi:hypothetical protein